MIEVIAFELAYCNQCHFPAVCGKFRLCGWQHIFHLCGRCLHLLGNSVESESEKIVRAKT